MSAIAKLPATPTIRIEKNVPLPQKHLTRMVYPLAQMEIGDSFFIDRPQTDVASAILDWGKRHRAKFTTRKVDGGTRVWRIA